MSAPSAGILAIGNELLSGAVTDLNASLLIGDLAGQGVEVGTVVLIPDEEARYVEELPRLKARHTWVFTSGGIGPTHDDITYLAVARALGRGVVRHPVLAARIQGFYGERTNDALLRMADIPEGADLIWDRDLLVPVVVVDEIYLLPGEPTIFRRKWQAIRERFRGPPLITRLLYTDQDEGAFAAALAETQERFAQVRIGSYPDYGGKPFRVKVSFHSRDEAAVAEAVAAVRLGTEGVVAWRDRPDDATPA